MHPLPLKPHRGRDRPSLRAIVVLILTLISLAATAGCGSKPEPVYIVVTPNNDATVKAGTPATKQVEDAVKATLEAQRARTVETTREGIAREAAENPNGTPEPLQQIYPQPASVLATTFLEKGIELAKNGDYLEALRELKKAQSLHGGNSEEAEVWLSRVQGALGNPEAALRHRQNAKALREGTGQTETNQPTATPAPAPTPEIKMVLAQMNPTPTPAMPPAPIQQPTPTMRPAPTSTPIPAPTTAPTRTPAPTPTVLVIRPAPTTEPTAAPTRTPTPTPTILVIKPTPTAAPTRTPASTPTILVIPTLVIPTPTLTSSQISIPVRAPARGVDSKLTRLTDLLNAKWLSQTKPEIADRMASLPWAADGLSETEEKIIEQLLYLYVMSTDPITASLLDMPFLQSVEPGDLQAVTSLKEISQKDSNAFQQIMNHPTFAAGGITDEWTPVVAVLRSAQKYNKRLISTLLDQAQVNLETKTIQTPLKGTVALNIVRIGEANDPQSMDRLESAVRGAEALMGEPFPTNAVTVLYADAVKGSYAGHNSGQSITILPKYDSATEKGTQKINDHEVAHYYWRGDESWIDEGMATFTADLLQAGRAGTRILPGKPPCPDFRAIAQLSTRDDTHRCDYSLGERLFIDLHDAVGTAEFRKGMAALYRESTVEDDDNTPGTKLGVSHIRAQFTSAAAKEVIKRWYDGTAPYRTDLYDRDPVNPRLSVLNAQVNRSGLFINDKPVSSFSSSRNGSGAVLSIGYSHPNPVGTPGEILFQFVVFYQDGHPSLTRERAVTASVGGTGLNGIGVYVWWPGQHRPAPGEYVGYVYEAGNKVAQVHWSVTP